MSLLVVKGTHVCLCDAQTDSVGETLAEGTSGDLNTIGVTGLWVARRQGIELAEIFEIVQGELEAQEVEENVLEGASGSGLRKRVFSLGLLFTHA